jgi:hypothetical protein
MLGIFIDRGGVEIIEVSALVCSLEGESVGYLGPTIYCTPKINTCESSGTVVFASQVPMIDSATCQIVNYQQKVLQLLEVN